MRKIRTPFFEIGTKNYIYGDDVLKLAKAADEFAEKYDIDVLMTTPYADVIFLNHYFYVSKSFYYAPYLFFCQLIILFIFSLLLSYHLFISK